MEVVPEYVLATCWKSAYGYLSSDWIRAIGFGSLRHRPARAVRYLAVCAAMLALSGCLSLKFGGNDKPPSTVGQSAGPVGQRAGAVDVANSMAEASGGR